MKIYKFGRPLSLPKPKIAELRQLQKEGHSIRKITKLAGVPRSTVARYLNKNSRKTGKIQGLQARYGLSLASYRQLLSTQNNCCAICQRPFTDGNPPFVDHCHKRGKVRGLLHNICNRGIGFLKEDIETLKGAIRYLNKHRTS